MVVYRVLAACSLRRDGLPGHRFSLGEEMRSRSKMLELVEKLPLCCFLIPVDGL